MVSRGIFSDGERCQVAAESQAKEYSLAEPFAFLIRMVWRDEGELQSGFMFSALGEGPR